MGLIFCSIDLKGARRSRLCHSCPVVEQLELIEDLLAIDASYRAKKQQPLFGSEVFLGPRTKSGVHLDWRCQIMVPQTITQTTIQGEDERSLTPRMN